MQYPTPNMAQVIKTDNIPMGMGQSSNQEGEFIQIKSNR